MASLSEGRLGQRERCRQCGCLVWFQHNTLGGASVFIRVLFCCNTIRKMNERTRRKEKGERRKEMVEDQGFEKFDVKSCV